jgi:hypothetical protein
MSGIHVFDSIYYASDLCFRSNLTPPLCFFCRDTADRKIGSEEALASIVEEAQCGLTQTRESAHQQVELIAAILAADAAFTAARLCEPSSSERDEMLVGITQSVSKVLNMHRQLSSGGTFYSNLQVLHT